MPLENMIPEHLIVSKWDFHLVHQVLLGIFWS